MNRKRVVLTIAGSENDGDQLIVGLQLLEKAFNNKRIQALSTTFSCGVSQVIEVDEDGHLTLSVHRNPVTLKDFLRKLAKIAETTPDTDYILVMAAGWAAQLAPIADSLLRQDIRHEFQTDNIFVIAVGLEDRTSNNDFIGDCQFRNTTSVVDILKGMTQKQQHEMAAILSATAVPGSCLIFQDVTGVFFGEEGFTRACQFAIDGEISDDIRSKVANPKTKDPKSRSRATAVQQFSHASSGA